MEAGNYSRIYSTTLNTKNLEDALTAVRKKIKHHQNNHVYEIPQALDDNFPKKWVVKIDDEKCNKFHVEYLEQLAVLIGKLDIYHSEKILLIQFDSSLFTYYILDLILHNWLNKRSLILLIIYQMFRQIKLPKS